MSLTGVPVSHTQVKSKGDLFHDLFKNTPHQVASISPHKIQGCDLHSGDWGMVGSVIVWNYTVDGKSKVAKEIVEAINEGKRMIRLKVIEGNLLKYYKSITFAIQIDTEGANDLVTWTIGYEKQNENVAEPHAEMDFLSSLTKDIEAHYLQ